MAKSTKLETPLGELQYCFIKGEGRNQAMKGEEPRMQFVASVVFEKDSAEHKAVLAIIDAEWTRYKGENPGVKKPAKFTNGIKPVMIDGPDKDEDGDPIRVESDKVRVTFKTNTMWPAKGNTPAKPQVVTVLDYKGKDKTEVYQKADWAIGEGSTGVIHGTAQANDIGGTHKVTLYLSGVQLGKLVKYEGSEIDASEIDGEDFGDDFDDDIAESGETPDI